LTAGHSARTTPTTITQGLPQVTNQQTDVNYVYGSYNHKVEYFNSTSENELSVTAIPIDQLEFHNTRGHSVLGRGLRNLSGHRRQCVLFRVQCTEGADCTTLDYDVFNNFNSDFTITGAGVLKAPIGSNDWSNIIKTFVQSRLDPGTRSGSKGFSDFIVVRMRRRHRRRHLLRQRPVAFIRRSQHSGKLRVRAGSIRATRHNHVLRWHD
jgi:hypothetical protein